MLNLSWFRNQGDERTPAQIVQAGAGAAGWIMCSVHEWNWSQKEQEDMAKACLVLQAQLGELKGRTGEQPIE